MGALSVVRTGVLDAETRKRGVRSNLLRVSASPRQMLGLVVCALLLSWPLHAEIIDRIAVSVGNRVITTRDIDREIRVVAFENGGKPDFSPANRRATAEKMVEQALIRRELETSRYPIPSASEAEPAVEKFKKEHFKDAADYRRALAEYGITDADLRSFVLWERTLVFFIDARFRPGVQVSDREIQDYFEKTIKPAAEAAHPGQPVALEDFRDAIEKSLAEPRVTEQVDAWLQGARRRTDIVFHDEALQ